MTDAAFYEREYDTRMAVPDFQHYFELWDKQSAAARENLTCHLDIPYGEGEKEKIDLFPAQNSKKWLFFIHGGYWRSMDKKDFSCVAPNFVKAGISVAIPNYDLCPAVTIATITEQCRRAAAWLSHHANEYSFPCEQMIISGHSAGGHLTAMLFATDWQHYGMSENIIAGGVAISGLYDLEPLIYTERNVDLKLDTESAHALSPIRLTPRVQKTMVVAVGALESSEYHRQSRMMADAWPGAATQPILLQNCDHFNVLDPFTDLNHPLWQTLLSS